MPPPCPLAMPPDSYTRSANSVSSPVLPGFAVAMVRRKNARISINLESAPGAGPVLRSIGFLR